MRHLAPSLALILTLTGCMTNPNSADSVKSECKTLGNYAYDVMLARLRGTSEEDQLAEATTDQGVLVVKTAYDAPRVPIYGTRPQAANNYRDSWVDECLKQRR